MAGRATAKDAYTILVVFIVAPLITHQVVHLGGADEIVVGDAADGVGVVAQGAGVVTHDHLRMVVLAVRDPRHRVDEGHRLVVIFELKGLRQLTIGDLPALGVAQLVLEIVAGQRWGAGRQRPARHHK